MLRIITVAASLLLLSACAQRHSAPDIRPQLSQPIAYSAMMPTPVEAVAASCDAQPEAAFQKLVAPSALDRALLDRAILYHTNIARCEAGLNALAPDSRLRTVATGHSADMVRLGFFGHKSPVAGKRTVADRLTAQGVPYRGAAENLATTKRLEILSGQPVYPIASQRCGFSLTPYGPALPVRTYDAMARNLVGRWIESPGHRRNLMNPSYTRHGASGVIEPDAHLCESVNATQLFAS